MSSQYLTAPVPSNTMPKGIPYIIGNEAAERFSFYGMKGILVIFMTQYLFMLPGADGGAHMSNSVAMEKYHLFTTAVYFFPIIGALLADIVLGKYLTIMILSTVYCAGHGVLALMGSSETMSPGLVLAAGLVLISIGSGGIKPCVSAHVGDQFGKKNAKLLEKVFGWFYFSINTGAFLSTLLTPWLLEWYGPHLAFGIPGILMAIATFAFWMGRGVFIHIPAGGLGWFRETFSGVGIKAILKLSIIFIFIAVFWALFDQTGSSWVLQAEDLDRNWLGINWLSSQIQAVNPIMILVYIPLFQFVVYPLINSVWKLTPIRKISFGLFIMVIGFGVIGIVQSWIDAGEHPSIAWQVLAYAILTASEVMVSITGLEFAYTQSPKKMKSVIMALFLMSVSLGNLFTAGVNHFIIVPDGSDELNLLVANWDTPPPLEIANVELYTQIVQTGEAINGAEEQIGAFWDTNDRLPNSDEGSALINYLKDHWGNTLHYRLVNRKNFVITSEGSDSTFMTEHDIRALVEVTSLTVGQQVEQRAEASDGESPSSFHPKHPWIVVRKAEIDAASAREQGNTAATISDFLPKKSHLDTSPVAKEQYASTTEWKIGGATTLEGAAYFEFFTWLMLGTAILFVGVAYLYKPKTFIQDEVDQTSIKYD